MLMQDNRKIFLDDAGVAADLGTDLEDAQRIIRELNERIVRKGGMYIKGKVSAAFYQRMKESGFLSDEGAESGGCPLSEKRLLRLEEFCAYSSLGRNNARKFAEAAGIAKRIGHKVLYDRVLFDEWCSGNRTADISGQGKGQAGKEAQCRPASPECPGTSPGQHSR